MAISKINKNDILWGYFSQFLYIGSGAILIPVAIANLSAEQMGLWYVFFGLAGLAQLLEFGLQPTVSRLSSYVYSGVDSLTAQGLPEQSNGHLNENLLLNFIHASKVVYRYVASGALFVLFILGTTYLYSLGANDKTIFIAWPIFAISSVIGFYFSYFNGLLQGRGQQTEVNKALAKSKLLLILIAIPMLLCGFGLLSLSISTFISVIYNRYLMYRVFYEPERKETSLLQVGVSTEDLSKLLILSSWRLGTAHLGTFLIFKVNLFMVSSFFGLKVAASYGLSLQLVNIISSVSSMYFNLNIPRINSLQAIRNKIGIHKVFYKSLTISLIVFVVLSIGLIFVGKPIINNISEETSLVVTQILILMLLIQLLDVNHSAFAIYLTTLNYTPFVKAYFISGVLIVLLSFLSIKLFSLGLLGLIASHGLVQLIFNNWYWPWVGAKKLSYS